MNNDIENQMMNNQIKKLSCVACTIIIGTFVFNLLIPNFINIFSMK